MKFLTVLIVSLTAAGICLAVTGLSLGFFFGSVLLCALLIPPLVKPTESRTEALMVTGCVVDSFGLFFFLSILSPSISLGMALGAYLILIGFGLALAGLTRFCRSASIVTILALAWLTWPVWLSANLLSSSGPRMLKILVPTHPLLALNGVLSSLGIWSQQPIAYRLTNLGQDVAYELPRPIWTILLHCAIGLLILIKVTSTAKSN